MTLRVGDRVPDVELVDHRGLTWRLEDLRGRPVVVVLHRHLACLPCQEHVLALSEHRDRFGDAEIVVVTFVEPSRLETFRAHLGVPFTFVADTGRELYRLLGAERGKRRQVWSLGTLRMYARLLRSGRRLRRPTEDIYQLGADAVVGRDGRLRYLSLPTSPAARPSVDELLAALD